VSRPYDGHCECETVVKALDVCFKAFFTFNLKYPAAATDPWLFLQQGLYRIRTSNDKISSTISSLVNARISLDREFSMKIKLLILVRSHRSVNSACEDRSFDISAFFCDLIARVNSTCEDRSFDISILVRSHRS